MSKLSRRQLGAGLAGALVAGSAFAAGPTPISRDDSDLLEIGRQFDMLIWQYMPVFRAWQNAMNEYARQSKEWRDRGEWPPEGFHGLRMRLCEGQANALDNTIKRLDSLSDAAQRIPVATVRGLEVKARMLQWDLMIPLDISIPFDEWSVEQQALYRFNGQVRGLAAVFI